MSQLHDGFPIFQVADVEGALRFYRDLLGFELTYAFPSEDAPQFVSLALPGTKLGLGGGRTGPAASAALWLYTDDVDATVETLRSEGVPVTHEPADQPWGERTAAVTDPDGYTIHIGAPSPATST